MLKFYITMMVFGDVIKMKKELLCFIPIIGYFFALKYFAFVRPERPLKILFYVIYHSIILVYICFRTGLIPT